MPTPLMVFRVSYDASTQDIAPSYADMQVLFTSALTRASIGIDPAKLQGTQWLGATGPRVTRKVHNGAPVVPGGVTTAVAVLGYADGPAPPILLSAASYQYAAFISAIRSELYSSLAARARDSMGITGTGLDVSATVTEYNPAVNGPVSFWADPPYAATQTHTKDRFPSVNVAGDVTADQNENPVGPNDPSIVPLGTPGLNQPVQQVLGALTGTLKFAAIGAGVLGVMWLIVSASNAYRLRQATSALRDAQRGRARLNPSDGHARIQRLFATYVYRKSGGRRVYVYNSAIPMGDGIWRYSSRNEDGGDYDLLGRVTHRELERLGNS